MTSHESRRLSKQVIRRAVAGASITLLIVGLTAGTDVGAAEPGYGPRVHQAIEQNEEIKALIETYDLQLFVPAADFRTDGLYPEAQTYSLAGNWKGDGLGGVYLVAPVWLPDEAEVVSVWLLAVDDDDACASSDIKLWMSRVDNYSGVVDGMATVSTSGSSASMQMRVEDNPANPIIEYPDYSYWLAARVCSLDHELYGAMIFFN